MDTEITKNIGWAPGDRWPSHGDQKIKKNAISENPCIFMQGEKREFVSKDIYREGV
jgi:hypothetical protein